AVVVCCLEGKTQTQAARQLGTTADAINSRLKRARHLLRGYLQKRGIAVTGAALAAALAAQRASAIALPPNLLARTTHAAAGFVSGGATTAASPAAIALAQGALR